MKKIISAFLVIATLLTATFTVNASIQCEQVYYPMYFNGTLVPEGDKPILSLNWNTYVPLRKVCEGTGLTVEWNDKKQEIYVENTAALAAKDYANLSAIYDNSSTILYWRIIFHSAFRDALGYLNAENYSAYQTCLEVMTTYEELIDNTIDLTQIYISNLNGFYDGEVVTKTTYDNIEECLKHDLIISLACNNLGHAITNYADGKITLKGLQAEEDSFLEDVEYADDLISNTTNTPGSTASAITLAIGQYNNYFYYFGFEAKKSYLLP